MNFFDRVLKDIRHKNKKEEATKNRGVKSDAWHEWAKLSKEEKENLREMRRSSHLIEMDKMLNQEGASEEKEAARKFMIIKNTIETFLSSTLLEDLRSKMPRSSWAGIRNPHYTEPKRTNKLRKSLFYAKTGVAAYKIEIPDGKVPYAQIIDTKRFITRDY